MVPEAGGVDGLGQCPTCDWERPASAAVQPTAHITPVWTPRPVTANAGYSLGVSVMTAAESRQMPDTSTQELVAVDSVTVPSSFSTAV